ncbi:MAG: RIP metalloprotease RseP [Flavobacteriia bacterium]|nr:RIP metalloprotease RseP [Flavobacteriia bacterium]
MDFWIRAAQLVLSLSILVILHELGHYIPAKLFKTRVEKFYLFFNPWFSLYKKKIKDTEWGIGWLPLGGYVKIAGMIDESMDKKQMAQPAQPWEFRSKPAWQRLIIMIGGVTVNLLLGLFIYIFVVFAYGEEKVAPNELTHGLEVHPYLSKYGIQSGDIITKLDGQPLESALDANAEIMLRGKRSISIQKIDGSKKTVQLPENVEYELFKKGAFPAFSLRSKALKVDSIIPLSLAEEMGLKKGDEFILINNKKPEYFDDIKTELYTKKNKKIEIQVLRNQKDTLLLHNVVSEEGTLGFVVTPTFIDQNKIKHVDYSFGESVGRGVNKGMNILGDYMAQMKFLFTEKGASSIGGFGSIGKMFPPEWDWQIFWLNTAFISIALAFMNILPIPALDGGHVVFLIYEMITGKEAPQKVLEIAQYIGFILLLGLLLYANGNDLFRFLFK